MMVSNAGKTLIPSIGRKIESKLRNLGLKPGIGPQEFLKRYGFKKHRYFTPCIANNKQIVGFYARLHNNQDTKEKFIREINFLKRIEKSNLRINRLIPDILDSGITKDFEWFIREYPKAPPLGESSYMTQKTFPSMHKKIADTILDISKIPTKKFIKLKKFNHQNYLTPGEYEGLVKQKVLSKQLADKLLKDANKNLSLLKKENKYLCHGDLNLGNVLSDKKELWIIDWELAHINNFTYDICYLWAHLWGAKSPFRKKLIETYVDKLNKNQLSIFKKIFPIVASYLAVSGARHRVTGEKRRERQQRKTFYTKLLKNCSDFKQLIKI
jgi:thiamine kinase-like enzyme